MKKMKNVILVSNLFLDRHPIYLLLGILLISPKLTVFVK